MDLIQLKNVPALISRLDGVSKLKEMGILNNIDLWINKKYSTNHVRSLLIKYASKI